MDVAYAPDQSSDANRALQLLANIKESLLDLFDTDKSFYISNQSMRVLLNGLGDRVEKAVEAGKEDALFEQWNRRMPANKATLVGIASDSPVLLADGRRMPLLTENRSNYFLDLCPEAPEY